MSAIFVRTLVIYIVLIAVMRFLGKRQIGEMQISELVTTFLLSELASQPLTNISVPILYAVVPIVILICLEVFFSYHKSRIYKKSSRQQTEHDNKRRKDRPQGNEPYAHES